MLHFYLSPDTNFALHGETLASARITEAVEPVFDAMRCCIVVSEAERNGKDADVLTVAVTNALLKYQAQIETVTRRATLLSYAVMRFSPSGTREHSARHVSR